MDGILSLNMQKFALETGEALAGRAALADTMEDLIVDAIGALTITVIGFSTLKHGQKKKTKNASVDPKCI